MTDLGYQLIATMLALRYIGCSSTDLYECRDILQKKFYLVQSMGAKFGYPYRWYLRGPYSKDLAAAIASISIYYTEDLSGCNLTERTKSILDKVNLLIEDKPDGLTDSSWYELLSSMVFLRDEYSVSGLKEKEPVIEKTKKFKPWYSKEQIHKAWESINKE